MVRGSVVKPTFVLPDDNAKRIQTDNNEQLHCTNRLPPPLRNGVETSEPVCQPTTSKLNRCNYLYIVRCSNGQCSAPIN